MSTYAGMRTDILLDVFIVCLQVVGLEATHLLRLFHQNHPLVPTRGSLLTVNNYFGSNSGNTNNNGGGGGGGSSSSTGLHGGTNTGNNGASRQVWDQFEDNNLYSALAETVGWDMNTSRRLLTRTHSNNSAGQN